jgi:hypothetical protein
VDAIIWYALFDYDSWKNIMWTGFNLRFRACDKLLIAVMFGVLWGRRRSCGEGGACRASTFVTTRAAWKAS